MLKEELKQQRQLLRLLLLNDKDLREDDGTVAAIGTWRKEADIVVVI